MVANWIFFATHFHTANIEAISLYGIILWINECIIYSAKGIAFDKECLIQSGLCKLVARS